MTSILLSLSPHARLIFSQAVKYHVSWSCPQHIPPPSDIAINSFNSLGCSAVYRKMNNLCRLYVLLHNNSQHIHVGYQHMPGWLFMSGFHCSAAKLQLRHVSSFLIRPRRGHYFPLLIWKHGLKSLTLFLFQYLCCFFLDTLRCDLTAQFRVQELRLCVLGWSGVSPLGASVALSCLEMAVSISNHG